MRFMFKFPDIGEGLEEGKIIEWYVDKGQNISSGEPVVKMETDKVVTDIPSPKSGIVAARFGAVGETVHVGNVLIEIDIASISGNEAQAEARKEPKKTASETVAEKGFGVVGTIEVAGDGAYLPVSEEGTLPQEEKPGSLRKVLSTPVARAMAKELGLEINSIPGTGPAGRVTKKDVSSFHAKRAYLDETVSPTSAPESPQISIEKVPLSQIRKTIAKNMLRAKQNAAHMTVMDEVEVSELVKLRTMLKGKYQDKGISISYLPFVIKALTLALKEYPVLNAELDLEGGNIIYKHYYNLGIAVDTPEGLVVPVIRNADRKSIIELAQELASISEKAKQRKLNLEDLRDGTFSITSYGSIGGYYAVPVINYPQVAIFGIGKLTEKPVVKDGQIVVGHMLPISMSVDHRIVDGGEVARFLNTVLGYLQNPVSMLVQ
ncbi:MAG: dihydrolipoamide acetyltransferase family protein [Candidatus Cloacimonetes bacterium]|nr:dihydrolipoamide acetyltransferase family protein [Candidatus Cloacimonadota bacterium]